jgi:hypothetical protein
LFLVFFFFRIYIYIRGVYEVAYHSSIHIKYSLGTTWCYSAFAYHKRFSNLLMEKTTYISCLHWISLQRYHGIDRPLYKHSYFMSWWYLIVQAMELMWAHFISDARVDHLKGNHCKQLWQARHDFEKYEGNFDRFGWQVSFSSVLLALGCNACTMTFPSGTSCSTRSCIMSFLNTLHMQHQRCDK